MQAVERGLDAEHEAPEVGRDEMGATLDAIWRGAWEPPDRRAPWLWAEDNVMAIPYSPIPARFRSENSPWCREPLEVMVDPSVKMVQIVAAIQASKTLLMEVGSAYIISNMPGPMLWLDQTDDEARDQMTTRLQPLYENVPAVKALMAGSTGKSRHNTQRDRISFLNGMTQWVKGAHNKKNLQRRSIRWLFRDESWTHPAGHHKEAQARTTAFGWLGKDFGSSQAGETDDDTDKAFRAGDQREWNYVCEGCEHVQPYLWEHVEWDKEAKGEEGWDYERVRRSARVICAECGHEHDTNMERTRRKMNNPDNGACFVAQNPGASSQNVSFHWNGLCSTPAGTLAVLYLEAKDQAKRGDMENLKIFYQKRLALPWSDRFEDFKMEIDESSYREADLWDEEGIIDRRGRVRSRPIEPEAGAFDVDEDYDLALQEYRAAMRGAKPLRFLCVDCQRDHFWATVRSFSPNGDSRLMWWGGGRGETDDGDDNPRSLLTWEDIEELQDRFGVTDGLVFVDAGYNTSRVYLETATRKWVSLMGDQRATFTHFYRDSKGERRKIGRFYSPVREVQLGKGLKARCHDFSNLNIKDTLARIRGNQDPEEGITWEVYDGVGEEYLRQMDSEQRIQQKSGKWKWEQVGKRPNHLWDCEVQAMAVATMLKLIGKESEAPAEPEEESA